MTKNPERKAQTKSNLMEAFWSLYKKHTIDHISIREITELAGYNRSTFYEYFTDVYDLLNQVEQTLIDLLEKEMIKNVSDPESVDTINRMAHFFEENGEFFSVLLGAKGDPAFTVKIKAAIKPRLMQTVRLSVADFDTQLLYEFTIGGMLSALTYWFHEGTPIVASEFAVTIRSILMKGSLAMVREKLIEEWQDGIITLNPLKHPDVSHPLSQENQPE
jgi:AcrR family transcriptional regulator